MKIASKKIITKITLIALATIVSLLIVGYYWSNSSLSSITLVPITIMILALFYILIQIAKRFFIKEQNWWDWLYYIGLIAMMLPTVVANSANETYFHFITDYGTLFLIIPVLLDTKTLFNGLNN